LLFHNGDKLIKMFNLPHGLELGERLNRSSQVNTRFEAV
jgi:hypothetical protein